MNSWHRTWRPTRRHGAPSCTDQQKPQGWEVRRRCTSTDVEHNDNDHSRGVGAAWRPRSGPQNATKKAAASPAHACARGGAELHLRTGRAEPHRYAGRAAPYLIGGGAEPHLWAGARPLLPTRPRRPAHGSFVAGFDSRRRPTTPSPGMQASRLCDAETSQSACPAPVHPERQTRRTIMRGVNAPARRLSTRTTTTRWDRGVSMHQHEG